MKIETVYDIGDQVIMDNCSSMKAVVTAVLVRGTNIQYDVAWFNNGNSCSAWIEEWRLDKWDA